MSTPEFWNHWCKKTGSNERSSSPKWVPSSPDEELKVLCQSAKHRQEVANERRRMVATIHRLKNQGISDARCRECVAKHLPRGSGPKDRDDIHTFSELEVRACRRAYNDPIHTHVRNIQKNVYDMREQRQILKGSRHNLWAVIMEPLMRGKKDDEGRKRSHCFSGLSEG